MPRLAFALILLLVAVVLFGSAFQFGGEGKNFDLLLNLGTEVFGILVTLAVVDWMLEWRRRQERARDLAWAIFHGVERAVWIWQGGPMRLASDELLGLIAGIDPSHEIQQSTRALLVGVGARSVEVLNREAAAVRTVPGLAAALEELTSLNTLSEQRSVSIPMVSEVLHSGTQGLARVLGLSTQPMPSSLIRYRDAEPEAQSERFQNLRSAVGAGQAELGRLGTV